MTLSPAVDELLRARIRDVADWPTTGVTFKDIAPLLADHVALTSVVDAMVSAHRALEVGLVAGVEARGFVLGAPVAYVYGAGFVPVRKAGKLPGLTASASYALEYGEATVEVQSDAFAEGDRVLIVDDVLATGGTAAATVELIRRFGAEVVGVTVLIELEGLGGRDRLPGLPVHALLGM